MRFYINPEGVICWNPKGWPEEMDFFDVAGLSKSDYEQALSRAKAESVPVRNQYNVSQKMIETNLNADYSQPWRDKFIDVPDSEINKEWL